MNANHLLDNARARAIGPGQEPTSSVVGDGIYTVIDYENQAGTLFQLHWADRARWAVWNRDTGRLVAAGPCGYYANLAAWFSAG